MSLLGGHALMAVADDGSGTITLPFLSPLNPKDSGGVDLAHYTSLPYDRGHPITSPENWFNAQISDPIWLSNLVAISWSMWFLQFLITMQWADWITTPLQAIFTMIANALGQVGWAATAMAIAGIVVVIALFRGMLATGLTKTLISVFAFAIAGTILANPVGMITGPDGALQSVQRWGGSVSAAIASDNPDLMNQPPSAQTSNQIVNDALMGQVMDAWVRLPAQEIAFGHVLKGDCAEVFNKAMMTADPLDSNRNSVIDAVKGCDKSAGDYASHPTLGNAFSAAIASFGAQILNLMGVGLGVVLMIAIGYTLWSACKWMFANFAVMATFGYQAWWSSMIGVGVGLVTVGLSLVIVSSFLAVVTGFMKAMSGFAGLSTIAQLGLLDIVVLVMIIVLFWQWIKAKKAGERLAERLARLTGGERGPRSNPVRATVSRVVDLYLANRLSGGHQRLPAAPTPELPAKPSAPRPTTPAKPLLALTAGSGSAQPGGVRDKVAKLVTTGASVGIAAASGGTGAALMALSKEGGKFVLQRGLEGVAARGSHADERISPSTTRGRSIPTVKEPSASTVRDRPTFTGFGRRIEVDENGVSRVAPQKAPERGGVYRIASPRVPQQTAAAAQLRERLRQAASAGKA
ncbi:hypothetical protein [Microbacterium testaceum]|uniref:hypothetical protein n=1 Tax=Microbacterium testaceum TaxID=2033 RepID=UPI002ACC07D8|nr:hypothetical protein [Microbacterium testaceum]